MKQSGSLHRPHGLLELINVFTVCRLFGCCLSQPEEQLTVSSKSAEPQSQYSMKSGTNMVVSYCTQLSLKGSYDSWTTVSAWHHPAIIKSPKKDIKVSTQTMIAIPVIYSGVNLQVSVLLIHINIII